MLFLCFKAEFSASLLYITLSLVSHDPQETFIIINVEKSGADYYYFIM